jgi:hypothetical protein
MTRTPETAPELGTAESAPTTPRTRFEELMAELFRLLVGMGELDPQLLALVPPKLVAALDARTAKQRFTGLFATGKAICEQPTIDTGIGNAETKAVFMTVLASNVQRLSDLLRARHRLESTPEQVAKLTDELNVFWQLLKGTVVSVVAGSEDSPLLRALCRNPSTTALIAQALQDGVVVLEVHGEVSTHTWTYSPQDTQESPKLARLLINKAGRVREQLALEEHRTRA